MDFKGFRLLGVSVVISKTVKDLDQDTLYPNLPFSSFLYPQKLQCSARNKSQTATNLNLLSQSFPLFLLSSCVRFSYNLKKYDENPLSSHHQYLMQLSAWKQCDRPLLIGQRWRRSETLSQSKRSHSSLCI